MLLSKTNKGIGVIHGDIKPQIVLVFKDSISRKITVKVANFGYSTLTMGNSGNVLLPKPRPWNAPEHHPGGFEAHEAKKMDVYSFGMLCLWALFGDRLLDFPQTTAGGVTGLVPFDVPFFLSRPTFPECLKGGDMLVYIANHLGSMPDLDVECTICLKEIFSLTLPHCPRKTDVRSCKNNWSFGLEKVSFTKANLKASLKVQNQAYRASANTVGYNEPVCSGPTVESVDGLAFESLLK